MSHHNKFEHESQDARRRDRAAVEHPSERRKGHTKIQTQDKTVKHNKKK